MKIKIEKAFELRNATEDELAEGGLYCSLPRFADERDVYHLYWCDSGLALILRKLFVWLQDGDSVHGDKIPLKNDYGESLIKDQSVLVARFKHLFFGDIPFDVKLRDVSVRKKGNWLKLKIIV